MIGSDRIEAWITATASWPQLTQPAGPSLIFRIQYFPRYTAENVKYFVFQLNVYSTRENYSNYLNLEVYIANCNEGRNNIIFKFVLNLF